MSISLGLNVGAMELSAVVLDSAKRKRHEVVCKVPQGYEELVQACAEIVRGCERQSSSFTTVGIGVSGIVNPKTQQVTSVLLPFLNGRPFREDLSERLGKDVRLVNDANAMAWAEANYGAGQGEETVLGLIMGAGVGAGYVVRGEIANGRSGLIAEVGMMPMTPFDEYDAVFREAKGERCLTKKRCLIIGDVLSSRGLSFLHKAMTGTPCSVADISKRVRNKDKEAKRVLDRYYDVAAQAMMGFIYTMDPHVIVASGEMSELPGFCKQVSAHLKDMSSDGFFETPIRSAKFGSRAELTGAALLART